MDHRFRDGLKGASRLTSHRIVQGIAIAVTSFAFGAAVMYKEVRKLERRLPLPDAAASVEKKPSYIYLDDNGARRKPKKRKWYNKIKKDPVSAFPLLHSRSHDPLVLLKLAQSEDQGVRLMGVQALAGKHNWSDAEYQLVAQAVDPRTLVGLARTPHADRRFFLPQPRLPRSELDLEDELKRLMSNLPTDGIDKCTQYYTSMALNEGGAKDSEDRGGLWFFGGHGVGTAQSMSTIPIEIREAFLMEAVARHSVGGAWSFDGNGILVERSVRTLPPDIRVEMYALQTLIEYAKLPTHCPQVLKLGGLACMQKIHQSRTNNIKIKRNIARILANLAVYEQLHPEIIQGGWVSVLNRWIKSADIALSLQATKALANLDADYGKAAKYMDGVYLYYPQHRYSKPVYADVVFVHGLLGGPFRTWRQKDPELKVRKQLKTQQTEKGPTVAIPPAVQAASPDPQSTEADVTQSVDAGADDGEKKRKSAAAQATRRVPYTYCWPKDWLAKDVPNIRIVTVEYETHLSEWAPRCPYESEKRALSQRSSEMLYKLRRAGIGNRPVIWVGHSMGGLLIKQMLTMAREDPCYEMIANNSRGIVFYSVPHHGSPLAAYGNHTKFVFYPSVEVKELKQDSEQLSELHQSFKDFMFDSGVPLLSFAEGEKTKLPLNLQVLIVPQESSDPGFGEFHIMEKNNHLNICKPESRQSPVYQLTLDFIKDCVPQHLVDHIIKASMPDEYVLSDDMEE